MSQTGVELDLPPLQTNHPSKRPKKSSRGFWRSSIDRFMQDRVSVIALVVFLILCVTIFCAPLVSQIFFRGQEPNKGNLFDSFKPPSEEHVLGTDKTGRDVAVRLLYAGQISLAIGFTVAAISLSLGVLLGLVAGFFGGIWDDAINALVQIMLTIPTLFILILLSVLILPEWWSLAIVLGLLGWMGVTRQVRGLVLSLRNLDYVDAARVMGASNWRIMYVHILPNVVSIVLVVAGFDLAGAILSEASLSFLGFGVRPPTASWGNMLNNALEFYSKAPLQVIMPGLMIFITLLCIFLIADGLRDAFDPRLRDR
ncbi:MAG: ABC transporter permease [Chloroflexota bacterium]|nr:ABC transporter permease [Chloroflexota bacterium]